MVRVFVNNLVAGESESILVFGSHHIPFYSLPMTDSFWIRFSEHSYRLS